MLYCISNATIQEIEVFHMQIVFVTIDNLSIVNCCKSHLNFSFDFTIQIIKDHYDHYDHFCTLLYIICNLSNFYLVLHVHVLNNKLNKIVNIFFVQYGMYNFMFVILYPTELIIHECYKVL